MMYHAMSKFQLAEAAGVSTRTLARWLQIEEMQQLLQRYHIASTRRILPPKVVQGICEHFCIFVDEVD